MLACNTYSTYYAKNYSSTITPPLLPAAHGLRMDMSVFFVEYTIQETMTCTVVWTYVHTII